MTASTQPTATLTPSSDTSTEQAPLLDFREAEVFAGRVLDVISNARNRPDPQHRPPHRALRHDG